jgi:hypothetical protein
LRPANLLRAPPDLGHGARPPEALLKLGHGATGHVRNASGEGEEERDTWGRVREMRQRCVWGEGERLETREMRWERERCIGRKK